MIDNVEIAICTFGDKEWIDRVEKTAYPSALATGAIVKKYHIDKPKRTSVHEMVAKVRNLALENTTAEYIIYLDGDDKLDKRYVTAMLTGTADLRVPSRFYPGLGGSVPKVAGHSHICEPECLREGNYIVVGAMARVAMLKAVGGWRTFEVFEDWDLWQRCYLAGYSIEVVPHAKYIVTRRPDSRGSVPRDVELRTWNKIRKMNGVV